MCLRVVVGASRVDSMPDIASLLATKRYDPAILPELEAHVATDKYDLEANLAVLKLYQFQPELLKAPVVCKILTKALMQLPATDFLACTYLVPERVLDDEASPVKSVVALAAQLEGCQFRAFWAALTPLRGELLSGLPGFDAAIRAFVLRTFEITYQSVPIAHLRESLGLPAGGADAELSKLVEPRGWTLAGDLAKIKLNDDNTAKPKRVEEGEAMSLEQMTKILASVTQSGAA